MKHAQEVLAVWIITIACLPLLLMAYIHRQSTGVENLELLGWVVLTNVWIVLVLLTSFEVLKLGLVWIQ